MPARLGGFSWTGALVGAACAAGAGPVLPYLAAPSMRLTLRWDGAALWGMLVGAALIVSVPAHARPERRGAFAGAALCLGALGVLVFAFLPGAGFLPLDLGILARLGAAALYFVTWQLSVLLTVLGTVASTLCAAMVLAGAVTRGGVRHGRLAG